jgi:predicted Kef-type K+ transport protein
MATPASPTRQHHRGTLKDLEVLYEIFLINLKLKWMDILLKDIHVIPGRLISMNLNKNKGMN